MSRVDLASVLETVVGMAQGVDHGDHATVTLIKQRVASESLRRRVLAMIPDWLRYSTILSQCAILFGAGRWCG